MTPIDFTTNKPFAERGEGVCWTSQYPGFFGDDGTRALSDVGSYYADNEVGRCGYGRFEQRAIRKMTGHFFDPLFRGEVACFEHRWGPIVSRRLPIRSKISSVREDDIVVSTLI